MATPTTGKPTPHTSTPPMTTPFGHLTSSSPRGHRQAAQSPHQFRKSPANASTPHGQSANSVLSGINVNSPNTAAALAAIPPLSTISMDTMGSMGEVMPSGGIEGKVKIIRQIAKKLNVKKGRVGEQGIERLAKSIKGLECLWEEQAGRGGTIRTFIIAGTRFSIEVDFSNNLVTKCSLSFIDSPQVVTKHVGTAGQILLSNLQIGPGESPLTKTLDSFATNLERLALLDRLSFYPALDCTFAIACIYESLHRLHLWEKQRLREGPGMAARSDEYITRLVACTKSGQPVMNGCGQVGLSVVYWQQLRVKDVSSETKVKNPKTWSLVVECQKSNSPSYTPVRVSKDWISAEIEKAVLVAEGLQDPPSVTVLDWLEPPVTLVPATDDTETEKMQGLQGEGKEAPQKQPDVVFMAKFNPPLVIPDQVVRQVQAITDADRFLGKPIDVIDMEQFYDLLMPLSTADKKMRAERGEVDFPQQRLRYKSNLSSFNADGTHTSRMCKVILTFPSKADPACELKELPFKHPMQLIEALPILRQYARLASLVGNSFKRDLEPWYDGRPTNNRFYEDDPTVNLPKIMPIVTSVKEVFLTPITPTIKEAVSAFALRGSLSNKIVTDDGSIVLDVTLYTKPKPRIRLVFPLGDEPADIWFEIGLHGSLTTFSQNILNRETREGTVNERKPFTEANLAQTLNLTEDFMIFSAYVRKRWGDGA